MSQRGFDRGAQGSDIFLPLPPAVLALDMGEDSAAMGRGLHLLRTVIDEKKVTLERLSRRCDLRCGAHPVLLQEEMRRPNVERSESEFGSLHISIDRWLAG